jgi:hypothetical protein
LGTQRIGKPEDDDPMSSQVSQRVVASPKTVFERPFYPAFLYAYLPLLVLSPNLAVFDIGDSFRAIVFMALLGVGLQTITFALVRNWHEAALSTSLVVIPLWVSLLYPNYSLASFLIALSLVIFFRLKKLSHRATGVLNIFALGIFIQPLLAITYDFYMAMETRRSSVSVSPFQTTEFVSDSSYTAPNIVHILLDGYAGSAALKEEYDYDNGEFITALESRGFTVGGEVHTPYNQTLMAMASVFSGNYLTPNQYPLVNAKPDRLRMTLGRTLYEGPLYSRLNELGYSFLSAGSGYYFFRPDKDGILVKPQLGVLSLNPFEDFLVIRIVSVLPRSYSENLGLAQLTAEKDNARLKHAINSSVYLRQESPFHYFVHLLAPHPPFVIDRYGNTTDKWLEDFGSLRDASDVTLMDPERQVDYREGYLEKLLFINSALLPQLDRLIENVPSPKIIIMHGDHGSGATFHQTDKELGCLTDRYSPFFAVYSDEPAIADAFERATDERFNIVNIYRLLADSAFGTSLGLLEDQSWFASWDNPQKPERLHEDEIASSCAIARTPIVASHTSGDGSE